MTRLSLPTLEQINSEDNRIHYTFLSVYTYWGILGDRCLGVLNPATKNIKKVIVIAPLVKSSKLY